MRDPLRSKTGCWTCRMRKKKCDETRPRCAACESLSITCHGFGPKPQWMDDDEERRAFLQTTREASRRKLRQRISPQDSSQVTRNLRPAVKSNDANDDLPLTRSSSATSRHQDQAPADQMPSTAVVKMASTVSMSPSIQTCVSERHQNPITKHQNEDGHETERHLLSLSPGDFDLLMHFLDRVFVQQYPVYHPPVAESGRGWLLSDLLSTAALYHSALALSASHQRILGTEGMSDSRKMISMKLQEDHFAACMKLIHLSAKNNCPGSGAGRIGIGTAVLQLLFFELWTGSGKTWEVHLNVLAKMYHHQHENDFADFGLSKRARAVLLAGLPSPDDDLTAMEEVAAFRFLGGTILWLDIISSITSGVTPRLLSYHLINLSVESPTRLEYIMGCRNLIMTQIGRITALFEERSRGYLDDTELRTRADDIRHQVECALAHYKLETIGISPPDLLFTMNRKLDPPTFVTRMFAISAFIYLHLVVHGFRDLELLGQYISEVMDMIQISASEDTLRAVVCPLYITGIVAEQSDQWWFRKIFSTLPLLDPCLGHRQSILASLEKVWNRRQKNPILTWRGFVDMASDALLI